MFLFGESTFSHCNVKIEKLQIKYTESRQEKLSLQLQPKTTPLILCFEFIILHMLHCHGLSFFLKYFSHYIVEEIYILTVFIHET
jgi:hypothetical protein